MSDEAQMPAACSMCAEQRWTPDTVTLSSGLTFCLLHDGAGNPDTGFPAEVRAAISERKASRRRWPG